MTTMSEYESCGGLWLGAACLAVVPGVLGTGQAPCEGNVVLSLNFMFLSALAVTA